MTLVQGLLLAAGAGRRMGTPKALITGSDGVPWVVSTSRTLLLGGCDRVVVSVGAASAQVTSLLADEPVSIVQVPDWQVGMSAALVAGLTYAAQTDADAVLVHLVDLPDVGADVVARVRARADAEALARAVYGDTAGHPVLLGREHWPGVIAAADGDQGAKSYLDGNDVVQVQCADLARGRDHDTPGTVDA